MRKKDPDRAPQPERSGELYQQLLSLSTHAVLAFTPLHDDSGQLVDFSCRYANPQAERIFTGCEVPLDTTSLCHLLPPAEREIWLAHARTTFESGMPVSGALTLPATGTPTPTPTRYQASLHGVAGGLALLLEPATDDPLAYLDLLDNIDDMLFTLDSAGRITSIYGRALEHMGVTADIFLGKRLEELQPSDDSRALVEAYQQALRGERTSVEWLLTHIPRDEPQSIQLHFSPILGPDRSVRGLAGTAIDISALRRAEQAARSSEAHLTAILDSFSDLIFVHELEPDFKNRLIIVNKTALDILGYTLEELAQRGLHKLMLDTSPAEIPEIMEKLAAHGQQLLTRTITTRDGKRIPLELHTSLTHIDGRSLAVTMGRDVTHRLENELELLRSEERYRAVTEAISDYAYALTVLEDNTVEIEWMTPNYEQVTGIPAEQRIRTRPSGDPVHPEDQKITRETTLWAIRNKKPAEADYRIIRQDNGEVRWIRGRLIPEVNPDTGLVTRIYGSGTDITERKQAEQALAESERQMATLLDNLPGIAYRCLNEPRWTMQFISSGCEALTGYTADQMLGNAFASYEDLIHPEDREQVWEDVQAALAEHRSFEMEYRIRCADGQVKTVWERGEGVLQPDGRLMLEGFITDISEQRQAQKQRQEALDLLRITYDNLFDAVLVIDMTTTRIIDCNRSALEMFGYDREDLIGQHARILQVDEAHGLLFDALLSAQGERDHAHIPEFPRRRKDGSILPVEHMMSTVRDSHGIPLYTVATLRDITDQVRAETERRDLLEMLQATYDSLTDAIFVIDGSTHQVESCNKAAENMFGYRREAMLNNTQLGLHVDEESRERFKALIPQDPAHPHVRIPLYPMRRKSGEVFPTEQIITAIVSESGEIVHWISLIRDITEMLDLRQRDIDQRQFAEALARSAASLNAMLEIDEIYDRLLASITEVFPHTAASIMVMEGSQLRVAHATCQTSIHGYPCLEIGHVLPLAHLPAARQVINSLQPLAIPDALNDATFFSREGVRWIRSWAGVPLVVKGEAVGILNLDSDEVNTYHQHDVERLKAFTDQASVALHNALLCEQLQRYSAGLEQAVVSRLKELKEARTRTEAIFHYNPDGVLMLSPDGLIEQLNPSVQEIFGIRPGEVLGRPLVTLLGPDLTDEIAPMMDSIVAGAASTHREVQLLLRSGAEIDLSIVMAPVRDEDQITGIVCTIRDISELKEVERMKDAFASNVSHELRTPITTIKLNQKLIRRNPDRQAEYLERIERETERLSLIVDDLLRLSRLERSATPLKPEAISLNKLLSEFVHDFQPVVDAKGLYAELIPHYLDPHAIADPGLLRQVVSILATNAINYTEAGGFTLIVIRDERRVGFVISDTGPGITPAEQEKVWDRFYRGEAGNQSDAPGTGLGLALAREIIRRHNGDIKLDSSGIPGEGTSFSIWLPQA